MADLIKLLENITFNDSNIFSKFEEIAKELMKNYIIRKGLDNEGKEKRYAIVEIEFYLFSKEHPDYITYPRKMDAGRWFFHQSGVDLTFKTEGNPQEGTDDNGNKYLIYKDCSFGGILIRGLYQLGDNIPEGKRYIFGPQKCVNELWDDFNAFEVISEEYPKIVKASEEEKVILNHQPIKWYRHIKVDKNKWTNKITKEWIKYLNLIGKEDEINKLKKNIQSYSIKLLDDKEFPYRFFNIIEGENTWKEIKHITNKEKEDIKDSVKSKK